eukprot:m.8025 g.8025  ORF g.8025 m.8025 type:complete len:64 (+) comp3821_c0_seq1:500-691(+)
MPQTPVENKNKNCHCGHEKGQFVHELAKGKYSNKVHDLNSNRGHDNHKHGWKYAHENVLSSSP